MGGTGGRREVRGEATSFYFRFLTVSLAAALTTVISVTKGQVAVAARTGTEGWKCRLLGHQQAAEPWLQQPSWAARWPQSNLSAPCSPGRCQLLMYEEPWLPSFAPSLHILLTKSCIKSLLLEIPRMDSFLVRPWPMQCLAPGTVLENRPSKIGFWACFANPPYCWVQTSLPVEKTRSHAACCVTASGCSARSAYWRQSLLSHINADLDVYRSDDDQRTVEWTGYFLLHWVFTEKDDFRALNSKVRVWSGNRAFPLEVFIKKSHSFFVVTLSFGSHM